MFRFKWGRLLSGGILLTIIGLILTINAAVNQPERYTFLNEISYKRLSDGMPVQGRYSRIMGRYIYDFGGGECVYYVVALPSDEGKYISVNKPIGQSSWELRVKECRESIDNGTEFPEGQSLVETGKLREMSAEGLAAACAACEGYVRQEDMLPFYTEPYNINFREQSANAPEYPIGVGIAVLALGVGAVVVWILRPIITKE